MVHGQAGPLAGSWLGINRLAAPHLLGENESPDTVNTAPKNGRVGLLGPRAGRKKLSLTAFANRVVGILPYSPPGVGVGGGTGGGTSGDGGGEILVAQDDGSSVVVVSETAPWQGAGGGAWAGPSNPFGWSKYTLGGAGAAVAWTDPSTVVDTVISVPLTGRGLVIVDCNVVIEGTTGFDKGTATLEVFDSLNGWITLGVWVYEPCLNKMTCVLTPWNAGGSTFDSTLTKNRWTLENNAGMAPGDLITFTVSGFLYTARGKQV